MMIAHLKTAAIFVLLSLSTLVYAEDFALPDPSNALVGNIQYVATQQGDNTTTVAQRFNLGLNAIIAANPGARESTFFPPGVYIKIPTAFLLPSLPRHGIVINLPEMRMYYYPKNGGMVMTYPIGIGKIGKTIPIQNTSITRKKINPHWIPPKDIREFNEEQGITLPRVMPPGPDNPLGPYAIYLRIPTFLIHSTIFPESIGRRASFGCIRMNESDIKQFFPLVEAGTPVAIVDMPAKIGWEGNQLYMEAHPPLEERTKQINVDNVVEQIENSLPKQGVTLVNWQLVSYLAEQPDGVPHEVGVRVN
jgi:L,D-transpeptidase ErfK/SrfK